MAVAAVGGKGTHVVVRMPMSADVLGRSRFGISPCTEIMGTLRAMHPGTAPPAHVARWCERARSVPPGDLDLLTGLVPREGYAPDLLTPPPTAPVMSIDDEVAVVAATDPAEVAYHLDIAFLGRAAPPEVVAGFGGVEQLDLRRRSMPGAVAEALASGAAGFAARVATAMRRFFDRVLAPEWDEIADVLTADVAHRGDRMAQHGALALLDDLHDDLTWEGGAVVLRRPFDVEVDWADDGLLLVPSAAVGTRLWLSAERPVTPSIIYPARGSQHLWAARPSAFDVDDLGDLVGHTRATLLAALDEPRTTAELGRSHLLTASTVSYHLGILHRTGLVTRRRSGRRVVYARTDLAAAMLHEVREQVR